MGCTPARDGECGPKTERQHEVELETYFIDRTEVTVDAYRACHTAGACSIDKLDSQVEVGGGTVECNFGKAGKDTHPINCVDWLQASQYCAWVKKRLPTEAEWEKAARGTDGRIYPWGNERPNDDRVVIHQFRDPSQRDAPPTRQYVNSTWPVGSRPGGKSPYGALDMLGNVWEWTADWYDPDAYAASGRRNPRGPLEGTTHVVRGDHDPYWMRITKRHQLAPAVRFGLLGFRCARSAQ